MREPHRHLPHWTGWWMRASWRRRRQCAKRLAKAAWPWLSKIAKMKLSFTVKPKPEKIAIVVKIQSQTSDPLIRRPSARPTPSLSVITWPRRSATRRRASSARLKRRRCARPLRLNKTRWLLSLDAKKSRDLCYKTFSVITDCSKKCR